MLPLCSSGRGGWYAEKLKDTPYADYYIFVLKFPCTLSQFD